MDTKWNRTKTKRQILTTTHTRSNRNSWIEHIENIILKPNEPNMQTHSLLATTTFSKHKWNAVEWERETAKKVCYAVKLNAIASSDTWFTINGMHCRQQCWTNCLYGTHHPHTYTTWHMTCTTKIQTNILIDSRLSQKANIRRRAFGIFFSPHQSADVLNQRAHCFSLTIFEQNSNPPQSIHVSRCLNGQIQF